MLPSDFTDHHLTVIRFFHVLSTPEFGNCFTFNSNISSTGDTEAGQRIATMVGPNTGESKPLGTTCHRLYLRVETT